MFENSTWGVVLVKVGSGQVLHAAEIVQDVKRALKYKPAKLVRAKEKSDSLA